MKKGRYRIVVAFNMKVSMFTRSAEPGQSSVTLSWTSLLSWNVLASALWRSN